MVEGFNGSGWNGQPSPTGQGATWADNTTQYEEGGHSRKILTGTTAGMTYREYATYDSYNFNLSNTDHIKLWVYCHDAYLGKYGETIIDIATSSAFTKRFIIPINSVFLLRQGERKYVTIPVRRLSAIGGAVLGDTFTNLRVCQATSDGTQVSTSFDNLQIGIQAKAAILIQFDDGYDTYYSSVFPLMQSHNMRASVCVCSGIVDTGGRYITWDHLKAMFDAGWSITNHGDALVDPTGEDVATQQARYQACADALEAHDMGKNKFTMLDYMNAGYDAATWTAMDNLGIVIGRRAGSSLSWPQTLPYHDYKQVQSLTINSAKTWATVQGWIDAAIADKTICIIHLHDIDAAGEWTTDQVITMVEYIVSQRDNITPITWDDYSNLLSGSVTVLRIV